MILMYSTSLDTYKVLLGRLTRPDSSKSSLISHQTSQLHHQTVRIQFLLSTSLKFCTGRMLTKIFHPNISKTGEICVSTLKKDWRPEYGIEHILVTIKCLLIYPGPDSALDEEAGKLLQENYQDYYNHAKMITSIHAKNRPIEFDSSPSQTENQPLSNAPIEPATKTETQTQKQPLKSKEANAKKKGLKRL